MSIKTVDNRKKWDQLKKQNEPLKKTPVVGIGYPESKVENAIIAYATYNHFGTAKIPPRPFLAVTIDVNKDKIYALKKKLGEQILSGEMQPERGLGILGTAVTGMVKQTISGPIFRETVPNAPATIRRKGSSQPLIDTGAMRNATTFQVFMNGKPNE